MLKKNILILLLLLITVPVAHALEIGGISMPGSLPAEGETLILNGAGIRTKFFLKLYVGGLYLQQKQSNPEQIIAADQPMAIRLHIISSMITSEKMKKATTEGFLNSTRGNFDPLRPQIEAFISVFKDTIKEGDIFDFTYLPGQGVSINKNDQHHSTIEDLAFKQALFGIWLCDRPAQKSLKNKLLGE
ncbi:chalcone isomerase family protein [Thermodesulfobacteriota bacterium]